MYGLLVNECESGESGVWKTNFNSLKAHIDRGDLKKSKGFVSFEYRGDGNGRKLQLIDDTMAAGEIIGFIQGNLDNFIVHSNETKRHYNIWKKWLTEIDLSTNAILTIDFSENLLLPIYREAQSMYWIRKHIHWGWYVETVKLFRKFILGMFPRIEKTTNRTLLVPLMIA